MTVKELLDLNNTDPLASVPLSERDKKNLEELTSGLTATFIRKPNLK